MNYQQKSSTVECFFISRIESADRSGVRRWMKSVDPVPQRPVRCSKPIFRPRLTTYPRKGSLVCVCLCVFVGVCVCEWMKWMGALLGRNRRNGTERNVAIYSRALITSNLPAVINHRRCVGRSVGRELAGVKTAGSKPGFSILEKNFTSCYIATHYTFSTAEISKLYSKEIIKF